MVCEEKTILVLFATLREYGSFIYVDWCLVFSEDNKMKHTVNHAYCQSRFKWIHLTVKHGSIMHNKKD